MKESQFIGTLMPSHPHFQPIIQEMREKYNLPEIDPDGEPIKEIYLDDKIIPLEEFLHELESIVIRSTSFLPPELATYYKLGKPGLGKPIDPQGRVLPDDVMAYVNVTYSLLQNQMSTIIPIVDNHYKAIIQMLYVYLLTGESEEVPDDWISQVFVASMFDTKVIQVVATQVSDPEVIVQHFRALYNKTFGKHQPKVTKTAVSTAYYLQIKKLHKPWDFIVEEYIKRNKISLPRDKTSKRYFDVRRRHAGRLKKRIERSEAILNVLLGDK